MSSSHAWIAPVLGAWLLSTTLASAQDAGTTRGQGGIDVNPISIGEEDVNTLEDVLRLGIDDCLAHATVLFDLDGVPDSKSSIDVYIGDGCNATDRMNTDENRCTHLLTQATNGQTRDLEIELDAALVFDACDDGMEAERTLWFLAVDDPQGRDEVGTGYGTVRIQADARAPDAPSNVKGGSGEREIDVDWDTDDAELEGFVIYIDNGMGGGGAGSSAEPDEDGGAGTAVDCGSGRLHPGSEAPDPDDFDHVVEVNQSTATGETLSPEQIGGSSAAIAVVAIDLAGNRSQLSELACVSVMPTESFWDRYQANGGEGQAGCPCSALGPVHAQSAWPVALALLFMRRSARRRRSS